MSRLRRIAIITVFFFLAGLLAYGFYLINGETDVTVLRKGHRCIGFSVAGGFFILMPLFIYHRWKDKKVKDYMLTEENIMKMKAIKDSKKT